MKIFIGCDHRGIDFQNKIYDYLVNKGYEVTKSSLPHSDKDDYPDFAFDVGNSIIHNPGSLGILLCGTGIGISIAANKVKGIRAARCLTKEDASSARAHNNANVVCLAAGNNTDENIFAIVDEFINATPLTDERHVNRVNKIVRYETGNYYEF